MTQTKDELHKHRAKQIKYERLKVDNPSYNGTSGRVLKLHVCECGYEWGVDLLAEMPEKGGK